jgi:NADH:ubiquinone oxidoreductase subunit E
MNQETVVSIVEGRSNGVGGLIAILEDIQSRFGYLPKDALSVVAERTGRSLVDIYGVATFYKSFSLEPRGKHLVSVCLGTACHVRNAPVVAEEFERQLGLNGGSGTTADGEFTLEKVNCLGACALGPIVVVDGHYFSKVGTGDVKKILKKARKGLDAVVVTEDERVFPVETSCPRCNHSLMDSRRLVDGLPAIRVTASFGRKHGWLLLSSLYGSYTVESEYEIPMDTVVNFFCPHCHADLSSRSTCSVCGASMVPMIVRGGGVVQICARRGCRGHMLDVNGVNL